MSVDLDEMEEAGNELEEWLVEQAENGILEIVLIGLLRDYADDIEQLGYVPRMWARPSDETNQPFVIVPNRNRPTPSSDASSRCVSEPLEPVNLRAPAAVLRRGERLGL